MTQNLALCFSVSRICCYNIYKMACCVKEPPPKEEFDLICVGLDKSGKTALLNSFLQDSLDTSPTTGFNIKDIHLDSVNLHVKELGGSHQIRPYWARYYGPDIHGVMFVVDASETDDSRWNLARQELRSVLDSDKLVDAPVFVLATHQDCAGACGEVEMLSCWASLPDAQLLASLPDAQLLGQPPRSSVAGPASQMLSCWASLPDAQLLGQPPRSSVAGQPPRSSVAG
uniref:ADP-ribosylation factor-like protein 3 n=1 Tax=Macrostomum lignano TaxID=282301 RepID=A0A1I8J1R5_9PLAT